MHKSVVLASCLIGVPGAFASTIETIHVPGSKYSCAISISDNGYVLLSSDKGYLLYDDNTKKFRALNGVFAKNPSSNYTSYPLSINDQGTIVAVTYCTGPTAPGPCKLAYPTSFEVVKGQIGSLVFPPGFPSFTYAIATNINSRNSFVGTYYDFAHSFYGSYVVTRAGFSLLSKPGYDSIEPTAIGALDERVVGTQYRGSHGSSWLLYNNTYSEIDLPNSDTTYATGLFGNGWVVGTWYKAAGTTGKYHGFIYFNGKARNYQVFGSAFTMINSANRYGSIAGCYGLSMYAADAFVSKH